MKRYDVNQDIVGTAKIFGLLPTPTYTHVACRLTGWEGWLPFSRVTLTENTAGRPVLHRQACVLNAFNPCGLVSLHYLRTEWEAMFNTTTHTHAAVSLLCVVRAMRQWMFSDAPLTESQIAQCESYFTQTRNWTRVYRALSTDVLEFLGAKLVVIDSVSKAKELYAEFYEPKG